MSYEVELKFPVADLTAFSQKLTTQSVAISTAQEEIDLYLAHPSRDFAQTDEALRLRRKGDANYITYKGPKIDATTKTRREIELPLAPGPESLASWTALLDAVGFRTVAEVRKSRRTAAIPWQGRSIEACLDEVAGVGTYVEFELIAEANELDAARACIESLAQSLGLTRGERRSYLELLLKGSK
jgi:adenylate cyclase class 2